jgi:hypothetical protein
MQQPSNSQDMSKSQGLIAVNDLTYVLEPDLSVASNKTHKTHHFQSSNYTSSQRAICILNSGADYIDTRRSWLQFDVNYSTPTPELRTDHMAVNNAVDNVGTSTYQNTAHADTTTHGSFGTHGSVCNLIKSIVISTRSGDELCHLDDFNLLQHMLVPLHYGHEWTEGPGALMGFGSGVANSGTENVASTRRFAIPMYILAPLFGYGRLMPSMLMSGMRIEIEWAPAKTAFQCIKNTVFDIHGRVLGTNVDATFSGTDGTFRCVEREVVYTVSDPQFVLSSVQLSDSIQRALNELSATNGLEIVYTDYASTPGGTNTELLDINTEVRKSCSRALKAFARVRPNSYNAAAFNGDENSVGTYLNPRLDGGDPEGGVGQESCNDSFRAEQKFPFKEYQWQLGSLYFPQQPVSGGTNDVTAPAKCAVSAFAHMLEAVDKYHDNASIFTTFKSIPDHSYEEAKTLGRNSLIAPVGKRVLEYGYEGQATTIAVTLERSTMFNLAGVPVNNSRVLALRGKLTNVISEKMLNAPGGARATLNKRQLNIFLKYVKLARVFLNNVEVEQ